jgi:hypothetical protein
MKKIMTEEEIKRKLSDRPHLSIDYSTYSGAHNTAKFLDLEYGTWWPPKAIYVISQGHNHPKRAKILNNFSRSYSIGEIELYLAENTPFISIKRDTFVGASKKAVYVDSEFGEWTTTFVKIKTCRYLHPKRGNTIGGEKHRISEKEAIDRLKVKPYIRIKEGTYSKMSEYATFIDDLYGEWRTKAREVITYGTEHPRRRMGKDSKVQIELLNTITNVFPFASKYYDSKVDIKDKPYIKGFEIDIFIKDMKLGIEFDGDYWHSFDGLSKSRKNWPENDIRNYHQIKDDYFLSKGIRLLHIKESDWYANKDIQIERCFRFLRPP